MHALDLPPPARHSLPSMQHSGRPLPARADSYMPVSIRSRLLLLVLSVLLPAAAAALWLIARSYDAEQQALQRNLHDSARALSLIVSRELAQRPAELQRAVEALQLPRDWVVTVLDDRQALVARYPDGPANAAAAIGPELRQRLAQQREGGFESTGASGGSVVGYFSRSDPGWTFLATLPRTQIVRGIPDGVLQTGLGALAVLALAVLGALWLARRIVAPVVSLKHAAARLQAGLPVERQTSGIAECDDVGDALAQASDAIRHARGELERQVADAVARTRVAEQRVSRSQRVEALGRLTGGVAHDFNNLLGVISNSTHLIRRQTQAPELQGPLAATLRAVEVGSRLTQHLLRFSRRQSAVPQALDPAQYLSEEQDLLQTVVGKRIQVSVAVAPGTLHVTVDSSELELALINLALNARDAMPSGGHLWLKAENAAFETLSGLAPGRYVALTVSDDGIGMDEGLAERVFEPFFTTKEVGKGTGLGLSQVHGFCTQAGGAARLDSTPGLGTAVTLVLPGGDAPPGSAAAQAGDAEGIAGTNVLLVEDNDELADVTAALLGSYDCRVQRARNADEALRRLHDPAPIDVVLSDIVMPGALDGVGFARMLRDERPGLPVVLISGYSTARVGTREFVVLQKPCAPEDLLAALQQAVGGNRQHR